MSAKKHSLYPTNHTFNTDIIVGPGWGWTMRGSIQNAFVTLSSSEKVKQKNQKAQKWAEKMAFLRQVNNEINPAKLAAIYGE